MARLDGEIEYKCGQCGGVSRERGWKQHREKNKKCIAAKGSDLLLMIKQEAPPPADPAAAQTFAGSPFVHTPIAPGPPRTALPKTMAETKVEKPRGAAGKKPAAKKPRKGDLRAGMARMSAAMAAKRSEREALQATAQGGAGPSSSPGPSSSAAADDDEVQVTGERTREDRDAELLEQAVDVDP